MHEPPAVKGIAMPGSKATRERRLAEGKCCRCERLRKSAKFCAWHLEYFKKYRRLYKTENPAPKVYRCTICRKIGHNRNQCDEPEAILSRGKHELN